MICRYPCAQAQMSIIFYWQTKHSDVLQFVLWQMILKIADALEIHPADLFLRNASQSREEVRKFFDEELSPKVREMVEKGFL